MGVLFGVRHFQYCRADCCVLCQQGKTFNSGANTKVVLPIYIVFTIALICFSQWLNPTIYGWILNDIGWGDAAARNIATACCSVLQFVLYFPVDKILFHKKKEETPADNKDGKKA